MIERRKHERFLVERRAITVLWPASSVVGQISDISLGGLAFRYSSSEKCKDNASEIEIILASHDYRSQALPFRTVFDVQIHGYLGSVMGRQIRQRGIAFKELTEEQRADIQCFIDGYCWRIPA
jgi:hypothetical protein